MFIHWGVYSQPARGEWIMHREGIPVAEYENLADSWKPGPYPARTWARLARRAGMKYMVFTSKHHDGFCLWDSNMTDYNATRRGPKRDLVAEYVEACRAEGLRVGLYYSLRDWHHPDGARCVRYEKARRRFLDFTQGCVRELMTRYGQIDILWYDGPGPLSTPEAWESEKMNAMVRELQPDILINNRSLLPEDFGTPEGHLSAAPEGRAWEACMTLNGYWCYTPTPPEDWLPTRQILRMLNTAAAGDGNLLLNIGPRADGSVPEIAEDRLEAVGQWLGKSGEALYGPKDRAEKHLSWSNVGFWSIQARTAYLWMLRGGWPGPTFAVGGLRVPGRRRPEGGLGAEVERVTFLDTGEELEFEREPGRIVIKGLPKCCPDRIALAPVLKIEFRTRPRRKT